MINDTKSSATLFRELIFVSCTTSTILSALLVFNLAEIKDLLLIHFHWSLHCRTNLLFFLTLDERNAEVIANCPSIKVWYYHNTRRLFSGGSRISRGGGANSPGGGRQHTILPKFPKNCMKLKEFGPPGGHASPAPPLDQPLFLIFSLGLVSTKR